MDMFAAAGASLEPLDGGWSGETFLAEAGGERSVVRIFAAPHHGPHAAEVQASLLRLVRGLLPVPDVREVRRADAAAGTPPLLVTSVLPGTRGDLLLPDLADDDLRRAGESCGRVAATLAGMPMLRAGTFADGELHVEPFGLELPGWVAAHEGSLAGWSPDELAGLHAVAEEAQSLLDTVDRVTLVHSDLNPKNLLLDRDTLEVTGVLDWEFAHAGHPFTDLGNLLRFDRAPSWTDGVLAAWQERHRTARGLALDLARAADLAALVELATRAGQNPVADAADARLRTIASTRDLGAAP